MDILNKGRWTYNVGNIFGSRGPVWRNEIEDLKSFIGDTIVVRFRGITGNGPYSDMAVDDINFYDERPFGIDETEISYFTVLPNPAKTEITVQWSVKSEQVNSISIMEVTGKTVQNVSMIPVSEGSETIDISNLKAGVYIIVIQGNTNVQSQRLIVL